MSERPARADVGPAAGGAMPLDVPGRAATRLSLAAAGCVLAVELVVPGGWGAASWTVLVAGLLLGLPHGAVDHLVPAWRLGWRPLRLGLFAAGYAALAAVAYGVFRAAPGPSLVLFVLVSAWHFGSGETAFADLRARRPVRLRPAASLTVGGVVLLVPLLRGLDDPTGDVAGLTAALAPGWGGPPPWASGAVAGAVGAAVVGAAAVLAASLARRRRWLEAAEVAVLTALAVVVPPLAAFGTYFGAWHSLRHVARVVAEDPENGPDLAAGLLGRPLRRFALVAAAPTAAVVAVLVGLWSWAGGWRGFVVTDLPLLAALTLPHVLVVAWADRPTRDQAGSRRIGTCGMPSST